MICDKRLNDEKGFKPYTDHEISQISDQLELLGDFMSSLHGINSATQAGGFNPMTPVFSELWPFIDRVLSEFINVDEICESVCRVVKHCLRVMGDQFEPYLSGYIKKALICYEKNPIGTFLYSVEFCFLEFYHNSSYHGLFKEAFEFVCE